MVKKEILSGEIWDDDDQVPLFAINEVTVEVNFVLSDDVGGGFDLKVVKAESKLAEERVQKAIVRMKPLVSPEELRTELSQRHPKYAERLLDKSLRFIIKGQRPQDERSDVPKRE